MYKGLKKGLIKNKDKNTSLKTKHWS